MVDIVINTNPSSTPINIQLQQQGSQSVTVVDKTPSVVTQPAKEVVNVQSTQTNPITINTGEPVYLDELLDVNVLNALVGQVLTFNGAEWVAEDANISVPDELNDLLDVVITNPQVGQVLSYNGNHWVSQTLNIPEQQVDNWSDFGETDPVFTYVADVLTRIDYASGNYKLFTYTGDNLTQLDFVKTVGTFRKTFNYDVEGNLLNIQYLEI